MFAHWVVGCILTVSEPIGYRSGNDSASRVNRQYFGVSGVASRYLLLSDIFVCGHVSNETTNSVFGFLIAVIVLEALFKSYIRPRENHQLLQFYLKVIL